MATPRYGRTEQVQTGIGNPAAGAEYSQLEQELEGFSARRAAQLDQQAADEGELEGLAAGQRGDLGADQPRTIRGRAFARAAQLSHQAALQTDIRDSIGRFQLEAPDDPDLFDGKVAGLTEGLLKDSDARSHVFIQQRIADYAGRAKLQVIEAQQQKLRAQAIEDLNVGAKGMLEDATTAAFEGDIPMVEARRQEITSLLGEAVEAGMLAPARAAELGVDFERQVISQEVVGEFDRLLRSQGSQAGVDAIRRWQEQRGSELGLTAEDHEQVTRQMITLKNRFDALAADERAARNAQLRADTLLRQTRVKDAIEVMSSGFTPPKEDMDQAVADLRWLATQGALDPVDVVQAQLLGRDFNTAQAIQNQVHTFRRMPELARSEALNQLRAALNRDDASPQEVQLFKALEATDVEVSAAMQKDPRGFLQGEGLIQDEPLDFSSADALVESLQARGAGAGQEAPRLTSDEADQFAQIYQAAELEERVALLGIVAGGTGEDAAATLEQLDAKGYKHMALLGNFVRQGQGQLAREIMLGDRIRGSEKQITPPRTMYQSDLDDLIGSALLDWPEQRTEYVEAALSKYAELKARSGDGSDVYQGKLFEQALRAVMPTAEVGAGRRVLIPPTATPKSFEKWFDGLTDADYAQVAGTPAEGLARLVRRRGRLVELGDGRYGVALPSSVERDENGNPVEKVLLDARGQPFELTYGKPGPGGQP